MENRTACEWIINTFSGEEYPGKSILISYPSLLKTQAIVLLFSEQEAQELLYDLRFLRTYLKKEWTSALQNKFAQKDNDFEH